MAQHDANVRLNSRSYLQQNTVKKYWNSMSM